MSANGLLIVYTGNGKGKTTAALGQAMRAAGHGLKVCMIQFIKGSWPTGEGKFLSQCTDRLEFHVTGEGFTWEADSPEKPALAAKAGWLLAEEKILSDQYDLIILDEVTYLNTYGYVSEIEMLELFRRRPKRLHLVLTGREAGAELLRVADLATEMREIKHPFKKGGKARKGIEY